MAYGESQRLPRSPASHLHGNGSKEVQAMTEEWTFAEWMKSLRAGEAGAAEQVFHGYVGRLIGLARRRLSERARQKAGEEDVVQSALQSFFVHHVEDLDLRDEQDLWAILLEITLRHCGKWNKRFRAKKRVAREVPIRPQSEDDAGCEPGGDDPTPEEAASLADLVEHLMARMTQRQRFVFQRRLQGYSVAEIATDLQLSEAMVYRLLEQVRGLVGKHLERDR
jgi:RNA polymerase sigma factor (sigma-70 family)